MGVEDIKKVNLLVNELLKHGIASSREEAVRLAEKMLNKEVIEGEKEEHIKEVKTEEERESNLSALQRVRNSLEIQINELRERIARLEGELARIKDEMNSKKQETVKPLQVQREESKEKAQPHPKVGQFNQDDVSIEKFFYYGTK